jgi:predicted transposase/invertase (TIGR01784 family)
MEETKKEAAANDDGEKTKKKSTSKYIVVPEQIFEEQLPEKEETEEKIGVYQPLRGEVFRRWMGKREICELFLRTVCKNQITISTPVTEQQFAGKSLHSRTIRLDIITTDENFNIYNVEAQGEHYSCSHADRCVYYFSVVFGSQLEAGESFSQLKKTTVIFINLENKQSDHFVDEIELRYVGDSAKRYSEKLKIVEINLNNILSDTENLSSAKYNNSLYLFALFLIIGDREPGFTEICEQYSLNDDNLRQIREMLAQQLKVIKNEVTSDVLDVKDEPINIEEKGAFEVIVREALIAEGMERGIAKVRDSLIAEGMERGIEKGMERGMEKGMERGMEKGMERGMERMANIVKLHVAGKTIEEIAEETKTPVEEIKSILAETGLLRK